MRRLAEQQQGGSIGQGANGLGLGSVEKQRHCVGVRGCFGIKCGTCWERGPTHPC